MLFAELDTFGEDERIDVINAIRQELHRYSPMQEHPVDCVLWVRQDEVRANSYNPNSVAPPEMRLLQLSIQADGYTQPVVAMADPGKGYEIVDGFHRSRVGREVGAVRRKVRGRLPVAVINPGRAGKEDRMAATIRHNRARGKHHVQAMSDIVVDLHRRGWNDQKIADELGMEADEVLRLKQVTGLAALFAHEEFSEAWEVDPGA